MVKDKTINRDEIYAGEVVLAKSLFKYPEDYVPDTPFDEAKANDLTVNCWRSYRSILFTLNEEKKAIDLLYDSPNYPVLNISDNEICLNESILIKDAYNLGTLLKYFGYDKYLDLSGIKDIRRRFFTGKFAMDHCELFGYKETQPQDWRYYKNGKEITNPLYRNLCILSKKIEQLQGHRSFSGVYESPLSSKYFDVLDKLGNNTLTDYMSGRYNKIDVFKPHQDEENIRRLTK